ncbi:MAG: hypothetical protein HS115_05700 [Spirochaetales bacterium]|nr:hypothetical protein [Spirochaetales bacterium]
MAEDKLDELPPSDLDDMDLADLDLDLSDDMSGHDGPLDSDLDLSSDHLLGDDFLAGESAPAADDDFSEPVDLDAEELEPIALSDDELEMILESAPEDHELEGTGNESLEAAGDELPDFSDDVTELNLEEAHADDDFGLSDPFTAGVPESELDQELITLSDEPFEARADGSVILEDLPPALDDDEENVALSEDELGNILADVNQDAVLDASAAMEEDITLSDAELGAALFDENELQPAAQAELQEATPSAFDELDDDGPITLTADELGNIVADLESEEAPEIPVAAAAAMPSILDDDDEEPVALSEDELSLILEDVAEAPAAEAEKNIIVLDEYEEDSAPAPAAAAAATAVAVEPARDEMILQTAGDLHLEPQELRKMIGYLDQLFDKLPEETIKEFSRSEYFDLYKKIMTELGL